MVVSSIMAKPHAHIMGTGLVLMIGLIIYYAPVDNAKLIALVTVPIMVIMINVGMNLLVEKEKKPEQWEGKRK